MIGDESHEVHKVSRNKLELELVDRLQRRKEKGTSVHKVDAALTEQVENPGDTKINISKPIFEKGDTIMVNQEPNEVYAVLEGGFQLELKSRMKALHKKGSPVNREVRSVASNRPPLPGEDASS